jgi:hypothetical protein
VAYSDFGEVRESLWDGSPGASKVIVWAVDKDGHNFPICFRRASRCFANSNFNNALILILPFKLNTPFSLDVDDINDDDVKDILKSLQIGKASGGDFISHQMLKNTADTVYLPA